MEAELGYNTGLLVGAKMTGDRHIRPVIPGKLYGRPGPGWIPWNAEELEESGIKTVVTLDSRGLDKKALETLKGAGLRLEPMFVVDHTAPTLWQMECFCRLVEREAAEGRPLMVTCLAGKGRTGTMIAAYLVWQGKPAEEAMQEVRSAIPGAIEEEEQERALRSFEALLRRSPRQSSTRTAA